MTFFPLGSEPERSVEPENVDVNGIVARHDQGDGKKNESFRWHFIHPSDGSRTIPRVPVDFRKFAKVPTIPAPGRVYVGLVAVLPKICEYPDLQHQLFAIPGWASKIPQP